MIKTRSALVAGSTGLVGGELLKLLLQDPEYSEVYCLTRRSTGIVHPKFTECITDFDNLAESWDKPVDDVFCTLGTTIKKAGSQEAFSKVDFTYVVELARLARKCGASQFMVISSLMADPKVRNFYLRVKGQMEQAVFEQGPDTVLIFRPSTLAGDRQESRPGEKIAIAVMGLIGPLLLGSLKRYRNIEALTVARAMIKAAKAEFRTKRVFESEEIAGFKS